MLTLVGTFLTRSGVVDSVHSFTTSAIGGWFLAALLVTLVGGAGPDRVARAGPAATGARRAALVSRESAFLFNNVLFLAISLRACSGRSTRWWSRR